MKSLLKKTNCVHCGPFGFLCILISTWGFSLENEKIFFFLLFQLNSSSNDVISEKKRRRRYPHFRVKSSLSLSLCWKWIMSSCALPTSSRCCSFSSLRAAREEKRFSEFSTIPVKSFLRVLSHAHLTHTASAWKFAKTSRLKNEKEEGGKNSPSPLVIEHLSENYMRTRYEPAHSAQCLHATTTIWLMSMPFKYFKDIHNSHIRPEKNPKTIKWVIFWFFDLFWWTLLKIIRTWNGRQNEWIIRKWGCVYSAFRSEIAPPIESPTTHRMLSVLNDWFRISTHHSGERCLACNVIFHSFSHSIMPHRWYSKLWNWLWVRRLFCLHSRQRRGILSRPLCWLYTQYNGNT